MITGMILVCVLSTNTCSINVSRTFYSSMKRCEERTQEISREINNNQELGFYAADTKCVEWSDKP